MRQACSEPILRTRSNTRAWSWCGRAKTPGPQRRSRTRSGCSFAPSRRIRQAACSCWTNLNGSRPNPSICSNACCEAAPAISSSPCRSARIRDWIWQASFSKARRSSWPRNSFAFTKSEIGRFFEGSLSRQELAETFDRTAGWPVALRIDRTIRKTGSAESVELGKALTRNFLDMRLLRRLSDRDCTLLLELSIFDWVDTNLVDEVLETTNTRLRLEGLLALDGLLAPVDPDGAVRRLHPVVKQHCLRLLAGQDPARVQQLHRRISEALTRRDQLIPAWRHAAETGDREFLGETMERVGVFRMWLREGMTCLAAADRFLTPALLEEFPRLALIRCVARRLRLQFDEARALYQTTKPKLEDMARRRGEGYLAAMLIDRLFTQVSLVGAHFRSDRDATGMQETGSGGAECQQQAGGERQWTSHQRCGQLSASSARPAPPSWNSSPTVAAGYCVAKTRRWGVRANRRDLVDRDLLDCLAGAGPEDPSRRPRRLRESLRSRATRVPRSAPLGDQCFSGMHWISAGRRAGCRPYSWRDGSCYASESPSNRSGRSHQNRPLGNCPRRP